MSLNIDKITTVALCGNHETVVAFAKLKDFQSAEISIDEKMPNNTLMEDVRIIMESSNFE